jgi:hypothetical protein
MERRTALNITGAEQAAAAASSAVVSLNSSPRLRRRDLGDASGLDAYPAEQISSGCSRVAISVPAATFTNSVISIVTVPTTITDTVTTTTTLTQETTATLPVSTTITVPNPLCTSYKFVVANGERANQYLQDLMDAPGYYEYIGFVSDLSAASNYVTRADIQRVYGGNNGYGWTAYTSYSFAYVLQSTDDFYSYLSDAEYMLCSIGEGGSDIPGTVGTLACVFTSGNRARFFDCPSTSVPDLFVGVSGGYGCTEMQLAAIPAC